MLFSSEDISSKGTSAIFTKLDSDPELKLLSDRIREFLRKDTITELKPLEQSVVDPKEELLKDLSKKWEDNGYRKKVQTSEDFKSAADSISKRW